MLLLLMMAIVVVKVGGLGVFEFFYSVNCKVFYSKPKELFLKHQVNKIYRA